MPPSVESLFDATIICDPGGVIRGFSPSAEETFGRHGSEMVGRPLTDLVPRFHAHETNGRWRTPAIHADGSLFPIEVALWPEEKRERTIVLIRDLRDYDLQGTDSEDGGWWEVDPMTLDILWSPRTYELHCVEPQTFTPNAQTVLDLIERGDRLRVETALQAMLDGRAVEPFEYRLAVAPAVPRVLQASLLNDSAAGRIHGVVRNVTEQRLTRARLEVHEAVAGSLRAWEHGTSDLRSLLQQLYLVMRWHIGALWVPDGEVLKCRAFINETGLDAENLERLVRADGPRANNDTLPGRAWADARAHAIADVGESDLRRAEAARQDGVRGAIAIPAVFEGEVIAIFHFFSPERRDIEVEMLDTFTVVGQQLGAFLATRRSLLAPAVLTPREREILLLASQGLGVKEIAERLYLSPATVKTHFQNVYGKLGVNDRPAAVAQALRTGMIT